MCLAHVSIWSRQTSGRIMMPDWCFESHPVAQLAWNPSILASVINLVQTNDIKMNKLMHLHLEYENTKVSERHVLVVGKLLLQVSSEFNNPSSKHLKDGS